MSVQMKLFPVRTQALRLPALVLVCLLLVLGAVLGFAVCRAVPQQDRQELSDYLHQYAQATADGRGPSASALSVAAAYFRYPLAAALLGLTAAGRAAAGPVGGPGLFSVVFPSDALPGLWAGAAYTWPWRPSGPDVCLFCPAPCF